MRYAVLATDYDGTLATQGHVDSGGFPRTVAAFAGSTSRPAATASASIQCVLHFQPWSCRATGTEGSWQSATIARPGGML